MWNHIPSIGIKMWCQCMHLLAKILEEIQYPLTIHKSCPNLDEDHGDKRPHGWVLHKHLYSHTHEDLATLTAPATYDYRTQTTFLLHANNPVVLSNWKIKVCSNCCWQRIASSAVFPLSCRYWPVVPTLTFPLYFELFGTWHCHNVYQDQRCLK